MKPLNQLKSGDTGEIIKISCPHTLLFRMNALGIRIGQKVEVLRTDWFRPLHICISTTEMFIRRKDAKNIWIDV